MKNQEKYKSIAIGVVMVAVLALLIFIVGATIYSNGSVAGLKRGLDISEHFERLEDAEIKAGKPINIYGDKRKYTCKPVAAPKQ